MTARLTDIQPLNFFQAERVLVPLDFSDAAFRVQEQVLAYLQDPGKLYLLHVLRPLSPAEPGVMWHTVNELTRKQHVEKAFRQRYPDSCDRVYFDVVTGEPSKQIIAYAEKQAIDLIVIPSHGYQGWSRLLHGSVAERVIRQAHCPVLVLRR